MMTPTEQVEAQLKLLERLAKELSDPEQIAICGIWLAETKKRAIPVPQTKLPLNEAREMGGFDPDDLDGAGSWGGKPARFTR